MVNIDEHLYLKCVLIEKTWLPGSSGVFNTDGSITDLLRSATGVLVALFSIATGLGFLAVTGVLNISEIPGN